MKKFSLVFSLVVLLCATLTAAQSGGTDLDRIVQAPIAQGEMREPGTPAQTGAMVKATEVAETVENGGSAAASAKAEAKVVNITKVIRQTLPVAKPATTRPARGQEVAEMPQNINVNVTLPPQVAGPQQGGTLPKDPGFNGLGPVDPHTAYPGRTSYFKGENGSVWLRTEPAGGRSWGDWLLPVIVLAAIAAVIWALAQANAARDRAQRAEEEARRAQAAARPPAQRRPPRPAQ